MAKFHRTLGRFAAFLVSLLLAGPIFAQSNGRVTVDIHFSVFSPEQVSGIGLALDGPPGARPTALTFFPSARSPTYHHSGGSTLHFVDLKTHQIVGVAEVASTLRDALLIFLPVSDTRTGRRFDIMVHDDGRESHTGGGLVVLNLSRLRLEGRVDGKSVALEPGRHGPYNVGKSGKLALRTTIRGRSYHAYSDTISLGEGGRALLLILPPRSEGTSEVQSRVLHDTIGVTRPGTRR